ncbi:MAG: hypothetical protein ABI175_26565 [Polyangiales bacterium]
MIDYVAMATLARRLLEAGKSQSEVLEACYGVRFPEEVFALAELVAEGREPSALYNYLPWNLLIPLERGGPPTDLEADDVEPRVFALDPSLVPLMILRGDFYEYAGAMICYRLDELAAGRTTIWGFQSDLMDDAVAKQYGDSIAAVIHAECADTVRRLENEYVSPYNRGAGSLDRAELDGARDNLARAEELIRRTAARRRPKLVP